MSFIVCYCGCVDECDCACGLLGMDTLRIPIEEGSP